MTLVAGDLFFKLSQILKISAVSFLEAGRLFHELRKNNLYKYVFGEQTWKEFLASPEVARSESYAIRAVRAYEIFIVHYGLKAEKIPLDEGRMQDIIPYLKDKTMPKEEFLLLVDKAASLSRQDLRADLSNHEHEFETVETLKCKCGYTRLKEQNYE